MTKKWPIGLGALGLVALVGALWWQSAAPPAEPIATTDASDAAKKKSSDEGREDAAPKTIHHTVFVDVVGPNHVPLAAATVKLVELGDTKEASTDADGLVTFEHVSPRVLRVELSARGYLPKAITPPPLTPQTPEVSWSFSLERDPAVSDEDAQVLMGAVMSDGKPVVGATVLAVREKVELLGPGDVQRTDASGRFVIPHTYADVDVPPVVKVVALHRAHGEGESAVNGNDVVIELPAGGFIEGRILTESGPLPERYTLRAVPVFAREHPLLRKLSLEVRRLLAKDRKDRRANELKLTLDHLMRGKSMRHTSAVAPAGVGARSDDDAPASETEEGPPGRFRIGPIAAHRTTVIASATEFEPDSVDVEVKSGDVVPNVTLTLRAPLVVTGIVTDAETNKPLKGARIFANTTKAREGRFARARTDNQGRYTLRTHAGVRQTLSAAKRGYLPFDHGGIEGRHGETLVRDFQLRRQPKGNANRGHNRDYVGIGAQLKKTDEGVLIQKIFDGGAAAEALKPGDVIVQVDGEWIEDIPLRVAVESILGEDGTEVELVVRRQGKQRGDTERVILERRRIQAGGG